MHLILKYFRLWWFSRFWQRSESEARVTISPIMNIQKHLPSLLSPCSDRTSDEMYWQRGILLENAVSLSLRGRQSEISTQSKPTSLRIQKQKYEERKCLFSCKADPIRCHSAMWNCTDMPLLGWLKHFIWRLLNFQPYLHWFTQKSKQILCRQNSRLS